MHIVWSVVLRSVKKNVYENNFLYIKDLLDDLVVKIKSLQIVLKALSKEEYFIVLIKINKCVLFSLINSK